MNSAEIIDRLETYVVLLELSDANPFKIRAYQNGIRALEAAEVGVAELAETSRLGEIKGIGKGLAGHIEALYRDQPDPEYQELIEKTPPGLLDMLKISGLGSKKVRAIYETLGISTIGELEYACNENRLATMKGFGAKSQANVLKGIEFLKQRQGLFLYPMAEDKARALIEALGSEARIKQLELAGSLRRRKEVVHDIDLVASCETADREAIMAHFAGLPMVEEVVVRGESKTGVKLKSGLLAELRLVEPPEFPHLLQHMTGSKEHNTVLGQQAHHRGIKINEYGIYKGEERILCRDEAEIYSTLGLHYVPPELRENHGEIEDAGAGPLPGLVSDQDIQGVFHAHTLWSDGDCSLAEMVKHCRGLGYSYLGLSDHSQSAVYAHGLEVERVKAQWREVDELNAGLKDFRVFKGIEVDILGDGALDYDDELLAGFDFVIASVHSRFKMERDEMTARILRAARHPAVTMLGHLTGRLLLAREGYPVDVEAVIDACAETGTVIELNAHPSRLDLDWRYGPYARRQGLKISINPDAHSTHGLEAVRYGVAAARKAGFGPADVVNTMSLKAIDAWLQQRRGAKSR
ncbi:MAG: DNA polymerase/3'-5' exonuclease PolX [Candidatus Sericytochromatia bacterium]